MDYRKVKAGDDLVIPAATWNAFVDAAAASKVSAPSARGIQKTALPNPSVVRVMNDSGGVLKRFEAVSVTDVLCPPDSTTDENTDAVLQFINSTVLKVDKPVSPIDGRWFVLLDPLDDQGIGNAVALGVCICRINVSAVADKKVDVEEDNTIPISGAKGHDIIYVKGGVGTAEATGVQLAVICLAGGIDEGFWGKITGNASIADNRWSYSFVEQEVEREGLWRDKSDGLTGTAYNTVEANNSASGIQGNSSDLDATPGNYSLIPVRGNPVVWIRPELNCDGNKENYFQYENITANDCGTE